LIGAEKNMILIIAHENDIEIRKASR